MVSSAKSLRPLRLRGENGVTLIEMMVVVAIVGLIAGVSFPAVSSGMDSVRLVSSSQSVAGFLNGAAGRSERLQQPVELIVSPKENRLVVYSTQPGVERELKMPDGVHIEGSDDESGGVQRLLLLPGGAVPAVAITLVNGHGARRRVRLDPITGFPHVETVEKK
jgi:prepilin-type N-terminal cleavage/methylation domain-containing protein